MNACVYIRSKLFCVYLVYSLIGLVTFCIRKLSLIQYCLSGNISAPQIPAIFASTNVYDRENILYRPWLLVKY